MASIYSSQTFPSKSSWPLRFSGGASRHLGVSASPPGDSVHFGYQHGERSYGHFAYPGARDEDLAYVIPEVSRRYRLRPDAAAALLKMFKAAEKEGIHLRMISAFRDREHQAEIFHRDGTSEEALRERAKIAAPPGYSEHETGYVVDLTQMDPSTGDPVCEALGPSFEKCPAFAWLQEHAASFGFELSFPAGNRQGVMYEPWHWRFVGSPESRALFERARRFNAT